MFDSTSLEDGNLLFKWKKGLYLCPYFRCFFGMTPFLDVNINVNVNINVKIKQQKQQEIATPYGGLIRQIQILVEYFKYGRRVRIH